MSRSHWIPWALAAVVFVRICAWPGSPAWAHDDDDRALSALAAPGATAPEAVRWLVRADLLRRAQRWDDAESAARRAASLAPDASGPALAMAAIALDRGAPARARAWLAPHLAADGAEAWWLESRARLALGDSAGALAAMDAALDATPSREGSRAFAPDRALARAALAAALGDSARARDGLMRAIAKSESPALVAAAFALAGVRGAAEAAPAPAALLAPAAPDRAVLQSAALVRGPYLQRASPRSLVVRWRTNVPAGSRVQIGVVPGAWDDVVVDTAQVTEHVVAVGGLLPSTRYWYTIGTPDSTLLGDSTTTFVAAPRAGAPDSTRIWVVGDSGGNNVGSRAVRDAFSRWAAAREPGAWLMLGDNAYGAGTDAEYQANLFDLFRRELRRWPLWPTRGNHDILYAGIDNDYYDHFTLPTAAEAGGVPSGTEAYYSFDHGPVHFVCLDSEGSNRSPGGAMLQWLVQDLAATPREWIVAYWHHPPYTKGSHDSDNALDSEGRMRDMRENVLPLLEAAGVDLVLTGHSHSYERSFLLDGHYGTSNTLLPSMLRDGGDGRVNGDGAYRKPTPVHGAHEGAVYAVNGSFAQVGGGTLAHPAMVRSLAVMGSMVLDVAGDRLDARFLDSTGVARDSFTIVKGLAPLGGPPPHRAAFVLEPARPSPFATGTSVAFVLPAERDVRLAAYDATGREVRVLARGRLAAGRHEVQWRGDDARGRALPPGLYFVQLRAGSEQRVVRVVRTP